MLALRVVALAMAALSLGCSSRTAPGQGDAGSKESGPDRDATTDAPRDAAHDAGADAKDASSCATADGPVTVTVVAKAHLTESAPFVNVEATIPEGCWASVKVQLTASSQCTGTPPSGQNWPTNCDPYDRLAQVSFADPDTTGMFLIDAVTSFGGSATWTQDVTDYAPILTGKHTYHLEIDTYNDPTGMLTGTASSHDATLSILLLPGAPPRDVLLAVPLFRTNLTGDADAGAPPLSAKLTAPKGATHARFDYFTSGHGANGPEMECDEFCPKENVVSLDGNNVYKMAPTSNCANNCTHVPISGGSISCGGVSYDYYCQQNPDACPPSATAPRSNWCPSEIIGPIAIPLPSSALDGQHTAGLSILNVDGMWSIGLSAVFYRE